MHEQRHAAEDHSQRDIDVASHAVPEVSAQLAAAGVDGVEQLVLLHHIEPGDRAERRADGNDVNRDEVHPSVLLQWHIREIQ